ncbi:P-loop NTPase family protein [Qipengyuania sp. CAU 1752]
MTEQKKIPLPGEKLTSENASGESSLLEKASGAFGLDRLGVAPVPGRLADRPMKRARKVERTADEATLADPAAAEPATPPNAQLPVPTTTPTPPAVIENKPLSRAFNGTSYKIDRQHLRDQGLIDPSGPVSELLEEFRIVKRQLLAAAKTRGNALSRRILVTSPHQDEGKTFCAVNLAIAMAAERDMEVLLVDADIAKPSVLSTLGLPKGAGFMDALANPNVPVEDLVIGTDIPNLWVLPAGNTTNQDAEYLAGEVTLEVLERLTIGRPDRIVIFDSPPALAASPAAELAKHVGQTVLIARADQTGRNAIEDSCQLLASCDDIKLLLNATNFSPSGRRFGSYYE